ncbi:MAG: helix-turn-helix domain-containing protein [Gelidibacter sp.]
MSNKSNANSISFYRENLGSKLKSYRLEKYLSIEDVIYMTEISKSSILKIEKGEAKNIDLYVEYAKAVQYSLETLIDFKIPLKPKKELPKERKEATKLTAKIREHILNANFLKVGKTVADIKTELLRINAIDKVITSTAIAGVMRNLKQDELITTGEKIGRKEVYLKV